MSFKHLRESLTILACIVILILAAALAAPYLVDWNAQRSFFETRLSEFTGEKIHLNGSLDFNLLPSPHLEANNISIGTPENPFSLVSDRIQLELSLPPLLRGEFAFTRLRLTNPVFRLKLDQITRDALANLPTGVKFERVTLDDATICLENIAPGKNAALEHLYLEGEAESLLGPFTARGSLPFAGISTRFSLSTGAMENGQLSLKLNAEAGKNLPKIGFAGTLALTKDRISQSNLSGLVQLEQKTNFPWTLEGNMSAGLQSAKVDPITLQWGVEPMTLTASGSGSLSYMKAPNALLNLKIGSLDLDRLFIADGALPASVPTDASGSAELLEFPEKLKRFFETPGRFATPLPVKLNLTISNLLVSNARFSDISASVLLSQTATAWIRAEGYGTSRARLSFDGSVETGNASGFSGHVEWASARPGDLPDFIGERLPQWSKTIIKILATPGPLEAKGAINLTGAGFFAHDIELQQGATRLSGTLDYLAPQDSGRGRLFAALNASRIDLQDFSFPDALRSFGQGLDSKLDLSMGFNADSLNFVQPAEPTINLAKVKLKLLETAQDFKLGEFEFSQSGGTNFSATGEVGQDLGHFNASFDSAHPAPFSRLLRRLWPLPSVPSLIYQEQNFAPAHLRFSADANKKTGQMSLQTADLDANLGITKFHAFLEREDNSSRLKIDAAANSPDAKVLWQQIGLPVASTTKLGPGNFTIAGRSKSWGTPIEAEIHAADSSSSLDFSGVLTADPASPKGTGELDFKSKDVTPYLIGVSKTASVELGIAWPQTASKLPLSLGTSLHWDNAAIKANHLAGEFCGASVMGELSYAIPDGKPLLEGKIDLDESSLGQVFSLGLGAQPNPDKGMIWPDAPFGQGLKLPFETKLKVSLKNFAVWPGLPGEETSFEVQISPETLLVTHFLSRVAGGTATGDFRLNRHANLASLEAKGELQDFQADLPLLHGKLGMKLNFAGSGSSVLGLVKSLAGSGRANLRDAIFLRSDPHALEEILAKAAERDLNANPDQMNAILDQAFSRAPLLVDNLAFDLNLSDGHLHFGLPASQLESAKNAAETEVTGDFDIAKGWLSEETKFSVQNLPKDWLGPSPEAALGFEGPLYRPVRKIESASLSNSLAEQSILKESERISNFEFDLHERAFFYERLRSERRRELEKIKLRESLQDKTDEDRRRAAELARSEHLKRDDSKRPVE